MRRFHVLLLAAVAIAGLGVAVAVASTGTPDREVVTTRSTPLGEILVDGEGVSLYRFENDAHGRSACSGACARSWPPLVAHGRQVVYKGHPLYTFAGDGRTPGLTNGVGIESFGGRWFVVGRDGAKIGPRIDT